MLITYHKENTHEFCYLAKPGLVEVVRLLPGANQVSKEQAAELKKLSSFQSYVDQGLITVLSEESDEGETEGAEHDIAVLLKLKAGEAKQLISDTIDLSLLKAWIAEEKRAEVKKMLEEQIKKIEEPLIQKS